MYLQTRKGQEGEEEGSEALKIQIQGERLIFKEQEKEEIQVIFSPIINK